ncbi:MAG: class F420-dependent oxidoreductase [Amycolatopsis sp.]|uniref:LLM class F420-dependent oxidoreductase n=1 Tax=Amycolatopsis sp. TaxID=37632 RepID=UPI0026208C67|nr:LLM class F420-dependent oxidoreductase [Amycolatopsis sp.]MCU1687608.1 class F420-dependent oxidoreductase [Amycolatopsis sp.]
MDLRIFTEPQQGASYDDLLRVAKATEDAGFDAFFRSDHYLKMGDVSGLPGPTDAWITLAGLARETSRIRLGTLVTAATFRHPSVLAISAAQVDQMSGGRIELGLGAGWFDGEHEALGLDLPPLKERFERYTEQLEVVTGLWETPDGETFSYDGKHYKLVDSPALPKPAQRPKPPVIIGGGGKKKTPMLAARFANEFNLPSANMQGSIEQFGRVDAACKEIGRDPAEITRSVWLTAAVGRDDAEIAKRAEAAGRDLDWLRNEALGGTPAQVVDKLGRWREEAGVTRFYVQILDLSDLDQLDLIASEVAPQL